MELVNMSADNLLYMQKRNGRYWVWMAFASSSRKPKPPRFGSFVRDFKEEKDALAYAHRLMHEEIIEYGLQILEEE